MISLLNQENRHDHNIMSQIAVLIKVTLFGLPLVPLTANDSVLRFDLNPVVAFTDGTNETKLYDLFT
jgi:hypothetical protein